MPRILAVDDDPVLLTSVSAALRDEGYDIDTASDGEEAFDRLAEALPDLILLDTGLPGKDGYEILKAIRTEPRYDAIPVVLVSATDDVEAKIKGLDLGAVGYQVKPIHPRELAARVRALIRMKLRHDQFLAEYQRLSELTLTDPLTGAYNRRALSNLVAANLAESTRYKVPLSCVMFDLDHFKQVNDTYGHRTGDRVLQEVSSLTVSLMRKADVFIRYGGEEFLVVLSHTGKDGACIFAERLREKVAATVFNQDREPIRITFSAGIVTYPDDGEVKETETMIALADKRLYMAKRAGRNRVVHRG